MNYHNGFQVFSVLFSSTDPLIAHSGEFESQDITGDFYFPGASGDTSASIVLGDPEAEEWANKALKQLEPDITNMFIRPFTCMTAAGLHAWQCRLSAEEILLDALLWVNPEATGFTKKT